MAPMIVPDVSVLRRAEGIWKSVVEPMLLTENNVDVAKADVVDAITNKLRGLPNPEVDVATTETIAYGDVVPIPTEPVVVFQTNWLVPALPNWTVEEA